MTPREVRQLTIREWRGMHEYQVDYQRRERQQADELSYYR